MTYGEWIEYVGGCVIELRELLQKVFMIVCVKEGLSKLDSNLGDGIVRTVDLGDSDWGKGRRWEWNLYF